MSTPLTFSEDVKPMMGGLARAANSVGAKQAAGVGIRKVVRTWLRDLEQYRPSKHATDLPGSASTHYYEQAAESITMPVVDGNHVSVSITQVGFRQRFLGGDIEPINVTFLTIPGTAIAYGRRAREFEGLKFAIARDDRGFLRPALVSTEAFELRGTIRNRRGMGPKPPFDAGSVVYWLVRHVHQEPDQGVLPGPDYIRAGAEEGFRNYLLAYERRHREGGS